MVAVRPTFHQPALLAKQAANIDHISGGRLTLNVVSSWWSGDARQYGVAFDQHDARYARTAEWLQVVTGMWSERHFTFAGQFYRVEDARLEPKPLARPRPTLYAGGESEAAKDLIARACDAYLMHGDPPERIAAKVADMRARRERLGGGAAPPPVGPRGPRLFPRSGGRAPRGGVRHTRPPPRSPGSPHSERYRPHTPL